MDQVAPADSIGFCGSFFYCNRPVKVTIRTGVIKIVHGSKWIHLAINFVSWSRSFVADDGVKEELMKVRKKRKRANSEQVGRRPFRKEIWF